MYVCMYVCMYILVDNALSYHGDLNSREREANLDKIRSGEGLFLVCTDIAARGDIHSAHTYIRSKIYRYGVMHSAPSCTHISIVDLFLPVTT